MSIVDDGVGQVMKALERNELDDNTMVIFTADHGFSLGHHGFWGHGQATWPSNLHRVAYNIPMLVRHPGRIANGGVSEMHVSGVDLFATLLDYVGLGDMAADTGIPSRSFVPLLHGEEENWNDAVYFEQEESRGIRTRDWLLMKRFRGSETYPLADELYRITDDPEERNDLSGDPNCASVMSELSARVQAYFAEYADPKFDLWQGGTVKSNTSRPWLWKDAWGEGWRPVT
jgi:arylsulfatase A-like enzyme